MTQPTGVLDGLVTRVLATYPYRFTVAGDEAERRAAYLLRGCVVKDAGWDVEISPDGIERDEFDDDAVHVLGWDVDEAICTGRLVLPTAILPTERACEIVVAPPGRVVDVGRMSVVRSRQDVAHGVLVALLCRLYAEMRDRGYEVACGMMSTEARRLMQLLGLTLEVLGPERMYWGQMRAPVRFELVANAAELSRRWH